MSGPGTDLAVPVGDDDHIRGPSDAPVTLLEYGDYECPDCFGARLVVEEVQERMGDALRMVWRHFPIAAIHPGAEDAAQTAEAAAAQGHFWGMHDKLLAYQGGLHGEILEIWARKLGLDVPRLRRELVEGTHAERVRRDMRSGERSGVTGTPTFFINGTRYTGRIGPDDLLHALSGHID